MGWATIAELIIRIGLPAADKLITKWFTSTDPTLAEWQELVALANKTSLTKMQEALTRAGIPLDDPRAIAFLELVK